MKKTNTKTSVKSEKAVRQKKVIDKTVQDCLKLEIYPVVLLTNIKNPVRHSFLRFFSSAGRASGS